MIRYAVVGAGWIAQEAFMPAVAATENSTMQAIVSGSQGLRSVWPISTACRRFWAMTPMMN